MKRYTKLFFFFVLLVALTLALASCNGGNTPANGNDAPVDTTDDTADDGGDMAIDADRAVAVPFLEAWQGSGHNAVDAEAFNHWNEGEDGADPAVEAACAKCHSTPGFEDILGLDGSGRSRCPNRYHSRVCRLPQRRDGGDDQRSDALWPGNHRPGR